MVTETRLQYIPLRLMRDVYGILWVAWVALMLECCWVGTVFPAAAGSEADLTLLLVMARAGLVLLLLLPEPEAALADCLEGSCTAMLAIVA